MRSPVLHGYGGAVVARCIIVDDNPGFLEVVRRLLDGEGIDVVGTASCSRDAVEQARQLRPDVALVDICLGEEDGLDLARELTGLPDSEPPTVILMSTYPETDFADLIAASPAAGFVPQSELAARPILQLLESR
jgi:DNA-binding NarL/FixJ family response regulator